MNTAVCPENATCANTPGGYECQCPEGYRHDITENLCKGECFINLYFTILVIMYSYPLQIETNVLRTILSVVIMVYAPTYTVALTVPVSMVTRKMRAVTVALVI